MRCILSQLRTAQRCITTKVHKRLDVNLLSQKWQQSGPSAAPPLFPHKKPIQAQSAGLLQACKWIPPIPPNFVKWGSMGLLLFFSASLSPHISVMSTVKWRSVLGPGKKKRPREEITAIMISVRVYSQQGCNCSSGHGLHRYEEWEGVNITYPPTGWNKESCCKWSLI